jgi:hypothetical protein
MADPFKSIENRAKKELRKWINSSAGRDVIYKKLISSTDLNPSTGSSTNTYNEYSIRTLRSDTSLEAGSSSSLLNAVGFNSGTKFFCVLYSELPRDPYDANILKDYIVDGDKEHQIKKCVPIFQIFAKIQV